MQKVITLLANFMLLATYSSSFQISIGRRRRSNPELSTSIISPPPELCLRNGSAVECVDPHNQTQCVPGAARHPAITMAFDMQIHWEHNETMYKPLKDAADNMGADLLLLIPSHQASPHRLHISTKEMQVIQKYFKVVEVPWVNPPGLSKSVPRDGGCCGSKEFIKLHAIGLDQYDAVVNLDTDMRIHGSLRPLFDCAASGHFLTARGSMSGVNGGMFAVQPSKALLYDMIMDLHHSQSSDENGWNGFGLAPGAKYAQAGFQGFLYYYFYQRGPVDKRIRPGQVDPCAWTGAVFCSLSSCDVTPLRHKIECPSN